MPAKELLIEQLDLTDAVVMLKETVVGFFLLVGVTSAIILGVFAGVLIYRKYTEGKRWR